APGLSLNLGKSGGSLSFGPRGMKLTSGASGTRASLGLPGTGLYFSEKVGQGGRRRAASTGRASTPRRSRAAAAAQPAAHSLERVAPEGMASIEAVTSNSLNKGFFARLVTPASETSFVDACKALSEGNTDKAYQHFCQSADLADGAFMAGYLAFQNSDNEKAVGYFKTAIAKSQRLGIYFSKYDMQMQLKLSISDDIDAVIAPDYRGAILGLVEVYQETKYYDQAITHLQSLRKRNPEDYVVLLSLVELLHEHGPRSKTNLKRIVTLTSDCENTNFIECAILLYRAKALMGLGLPQVARETLTKALRRRKGCPNSLRCALHYERAGAYEALKQKARARADLESVYTADPDYEDIEKRLDI
nr:DUF4236 domain-containing protein [Pseudomonadota bacterium]